MKIFLAARLAANLTSGIDKFRCIALCRCGWCVMIFYFNSYFVNSTRNELRWNKSCELSTSEKTAIAGNNGGRKSKITRPILRTTCCDYATPKLLSYALLTIINYI